MDADIIAALNGLLEEERADAEALVGLVAMATDTGERQALTAMGGQAAQACIDLHERLARLGVSISARVSNSVTQILKHERIDDRLRAFADVQRHLAGRCEAMQARNLDDETRALLAALRAVQQVHATWAEQRADEFGATRPSDVENSSPSHSVPRGERPPAFVDALAAGTGAATGPDVSDAPDAPPIDPAEDERSAEAGSARDERLADALSPPTRDPVAQDPTPADPPPGGEGETPAQPTPKPRSRRTRVGAQPLERRPGKRL